MQQNARGGTGSFLDARPNTLPEGGLEFLQAADASRLQEAAAANHREWFRRLALAAGGEAREDAHLFWSYSPGGEGEGTIAFPRLEADTAGEHLDTLLAEFRGRRPLRGVGCWSLLPAQPADLGARLLARGFEWGWQPHWMWLELERINTEIRRPAGLTILPVEDPAPWEVEDLPYYGQDTVARFFAITRAEPHRVWHFAARLEGRVVGHGVLTLTTGPLGVAGVYNVGVIPAARNQGIGAAISAALCLWARECGCRHALLNATGMGEPAYRRIGFQSIGHGQTWWWHQPQIEAPPPIPLQVAFAEALGRGDLDALAALAPDLPREMLDALLPCGQTPVELTVTTGQRAAAEWLVARGATLDPISAWDLGWKERVPEILARRPDLVNARRGGWQITPLHVAAERGDVELARLLLAADPDLSIQDSQFHSTPLGWARHLGRAEIVALIEAKEAGRG